MNDLDARRVLLADPYRVDESLELLLKADSRLAAYRDELLALDANIHLELTRDPVPDGLVDRLILHSRYQRRPRWGLGIAATLVALTLTARFMVTAEAHPLADAMLDHVVTEAGELQDNRGIEPAMLREAVSELGVRVRDTEYRIRHLGRCIVAGREGTHFTVDGPRGTVSFVILPGRDATERPIVLENRGTRGLITRRDGMTVGVFAEDNASREELERLLDAVIA